MEMTELARRELYQRALKRFGIGTQTLLLAEECAELTKACSKMFRISCGKPGKERLEKARENIIEEMADVRIMIEQMRNGWNISEDEIQEAKEFKLQRLSRTMEAIENEEHED